MNFSTAEKIDSVIDSMKQGELTRSSTRAMLNEFFNGKVLWTDEEAEANHILVRFNDKQGSVLLHNARAQYENAFMKQAQFFKVSIPDAPEKNQRDWETTITRLINKPIVNSNSFFHTQDSVFGGVCLHGMGAKMWGDEFSWKPVGKFVQDFLIPTDTEITMENLQYFAVCRKMRPGELFKYTFFRKPENIDKGWNLPAVRKILDNYQELNQNPENYDWSDTPEQMAELYKQNMTFYDSDSAPVIWFWDFYYREEESKNPGWYRKMMLDRDTVIPGVNDSGDTAQIIYNGKKPFSADLGSIIHFQFGDGNNVPPFMYHSIRSLAFLTYELLWTMNRLRCQWTQHVFEQMLTIFRVTDPADRSRLEQVVFDAPWGIIPEGLNFVTAAERYGVDANLVAGLKDEYATLVGNSTSAYTQSPANVMKNERQTKFEMQALMMQVSQLMQSLLSRAYRLETFSYREIARRFTLEKSTDFEVKKFQAKCMEAKIPRKWLDIERWDIEIEQTLGGGNRAMEVAQADTLMGKVNLFDPHAQAEIKHDWALAVTNNAKKARRIAPPDALPNVSDATKQAEVDFNTCMNGVPPEMREGLNHIEQITRLLKSMGAVIGNIQKSGGVGTPAQVQGLQLAAAVTEQHIQILGQDPEEKQNVKKFSDLLGKLMNFVKAFQQRQQEAAKKAQQQNGGGENGELAKDLIAAKTKSKISEATARQKMQHKNVSFAHEQKRKDVATKAEIRRQNAQAVAESFRSGLEGSRKAYEKLNASSKE
jgi:hypothetical protein